MPIQDILPSEQSDIGGPINHFAIGLCRGIWGPFRVVENNTLYCVIINENPTPLSDTLAVQFEVYKATYYGPAILIGQADITNSIPPTCLFSERNNMPKILAGTIPTFDSANPAPNWVKIKDITVPRLIGQNVFYNVSVANNVMYILYATLVPGSIGYNFQQHQYMIARVCLLNEKWLPDISATPPWPDSLFTIGGKYPAFGNGNNFIIALGNGKLVAIGQFDFEFVADGFGGFNAFSRIYYCFYDGASWNTPKLLYSNSEEKDHLVVGTILDSNGLIHIFYVRETYLPLTSALYHITLTQAGVLGTPQLIYTFSSLEDPAVLYPQPRLFIYENIEYIAVILMRRITFLNTISILKLNTTTLAFNIEDVTSTNAIVTLAPSGIRIHQHADFVVINGMQYIFWHERWTSTNTCGYNTEINVKYSTSSGNGTWSASSTFYGPGAPIVCMMVVAGYAETIPGSLSECEAIQPQYHYPM